MDRELKIEIWQKTFSSGIIAVGSTIITLNKMLTQSAQDRIQLMTATGVVSLCNHAYLGIHRKCND